LDKKAKFANMLSKRKPPYNNGVIGKVKSKQCKPGAGGAWL
jgi:hypothetical protein